MTGWMVGIRSAASPCHGMAALTVGESPTSLKALEPNQITIAEKAMSGSGSRASHQTSSAMTMITSVLGTNTRGLVLSKSEATTV